MNKLLLVISSIAAVAFSSYETGWHLGYYSGVRSSDRLQKVWPNFYTMNSDDKAFLIRAAMDCHLEYVEVNKTKIMSCLREGAISMRASLGERERSESRIETLILNAEK